MYFQLNAVFNIGTEEKCLEAKFTQLCTVEFSLTI